MITYLCSAGVSCRSRVSIVLTKQFSSPAVAKKHYNTVPASNTVDPTTTASIQVSLPAALTPSVQFSQPLVTTLV